MGLEKAVIIPLKTGDVQGTPIKVMYNPSEYSLGLSSDVSGKGSNLYFNRVDLNDFTVSLFFDTYEQGTDVRAKIRPIADLIQPTVSVKNVKRPPVTLFKWGGFEYKGVVTGVDQNFTMFLPSGRPVRARVTVTFKSVLTPQEEKKATGREACRKLCIVQEGDRLDQIAFTEMQDPAKWKEIAKANNIDNPLSFPNMKQIGMTLVIPDNP